MAIVFLIDVDDHDDDDDNDDDVDDDDDDDDVDDEVHHAASAASTGAAKEDNLLLPPTHQLLHSLPERAEYYCKTGFISNILKEQSIIVKQDIIYRPGKPATPELL